MNAILSLSHFCETHGPTVLFCTQAFHFSREGKTDFSNTSKIKFFGCVKKLKEYQADCVKNSENVICEACSSAAGYVTNDHQSQVSFLSTRTAIDSNVSSLMKQAAVRSLSCEVVPGKEGQIYFGDSTRGHVLSFTFFLKDAQARGFHRWYSFVVFMKDKHLLLNSWPFFEKHMRQMVDHLQKNAAQVYLREQRVCSQRVLRLAGLDLNKNSPARSLIKLTNQPTVFAQLHLWFTWLLLTGAKRLEERALTECLRTSFFKKSGDFLNKGTEPEASDRQDEWIEHFRRLRNTLGNHNFHKIIYSELIGRQIIVRGPKTIVVSIINLLRAILPRNKVRCIDYGQTYRGPDVCNILGLDPFAAVPKSSKNVLRLDIIPLRGSIVWTGRQNYDVKDDAYAGHDFVIKNESDLPSKLPSLVVKITKVLSDETLSNAVVRQHINSLIEQWHHVANVVTEANTKSDINWTDLMQLLGIPEQDEPLIRFWSFQSHI